MESNCQYITKKDFYSGVMHISLLVLFTGISSGDDGWLRVHMAIWAAALVVYYASKLRSLRSQSSTENVDNTQS